MWTFSPFGNGNFSTYSQGAIANGATGYDNTHGDYIASGQAFFVQENISGSVVFHENHKVSGTIPNTQYFGSDNGQSIRLDLNAANNIRLDEIVVRFNGEGSKHYDANWDAESFSNANQTLTSIKDGISMAIATRPINLTMDTVPLRVRSNATGSFILDTTAITGFDSSAFVQLNDNFLHAQQDIITIPSYSFNITSDTLSSNGGRFQLLINRPTSTLPVTFTNINGRLINDKAFIDWTVASEANTISYQVEKSIDGIHYATIVTIKATGLKAYHAVDSTPSAAINYYRIKTIDGGGSTYSRTIQLDNSAAINRYVKIFPTVISSKVLMVQFGNMPAGNYQVVMKDMLGRTIYGKEIQNTGAINTQSMLLNKINPAVGVYEVQVLKDGKRFAQDRVVVE